MGYSREDRNQRSVLLVFGLGLILFGLCGGIYIIAGLGREITQEEGFGLGASMFLGLCSMAMAFAKEPLDDSTL